MKNKELLLPGPFKNPQIFVFDEATSALDTKTEKSIEKSLKKLSVKTPHL